MTPEARMIYLFDKYGIEHKLKYCCDIPENFYITLPCDVDEFLPKIHEDDFELRDLLKNQKEVEHIVKTVLLRYDQRKLESK